MGYQSEINKKELENLFFSFVHAGLKGDFESALTFLDNEYFGVGMGEQGIVASKDEARTMLSGAYLPKDSSKIDFTIENLHIQQLGEDVAVIIGEVVILNHSEDDEVTKCRMMQTIGTKLTNGVWAISFTHASPTQISEESVKAYPIRFMDDSLHSLKEEMQLSHIALRDSLTKVLNREGFEEQSASIMQNYNPKFNTALFMIDLDDFKKINDRLGHQTGDVVLVQVAEALKDTFRADDAIGRMGGDEFMVMISGDFSSKFLEKKAEQLMRTVHLQLSEDKQMPISISIGIAYGRAKMTFEKFYRLADMALYSAKKAGKSQYHIIHADTNSGRSYSASGVNFISLQNLLDLSEDDDIDSKTPFDVLLENIPGGVVVFELSKEGLGISHCNEWFSHFVGYDEEEVKQMQTQDPFVFVHPDDLALLKESAQQVWDGADYNNIVYRVKRKDGNYVFINQVTTVTERGKDRIIAYGIETDVDEVIHLKQNVEDARKELEVLINNVPGSVVMFEFDKDGITSIHRNDWLAQLLGYTKEELATLQKEDPLVICHPDDLALAKAAAQSIRDGDDYNSVVFRVRHKDGSYTHMAQIVTVIARQSDRILMYGIQTDVEETYRLKKSVEASQKELESFIQTIPGGVLSVTLGKTLTLMHRNHWVSQFLGYDLDELKTIEADNPLILVHPDDLKTIYDVIKEMQGGEKNANFIYRLRNKKGDYCYVRLTAKFVVEQDGEKIYHAIITDVDEMIRT